MKTFLSMLFGVASAAVMTMILTVPTMPADADVGECKDRCLNAEVRCEASCDVKCNDPGRVACLRDCQAACRTTRTDCAKACDGN